MSSSIITYGSLWERVLAGKLARAGIVLNGSAAHDPQIRDPRTARAVLLHGSVGAGDAYMNGWWTVEDLVGMLRRLFRSGASDGFSQLWYRARNLRAWIQNLQSHARAWTVARRHYDLGNEFYRLWLDETMAYTCGYWADGVTDLRHAQLAKYDIVCRKLGLRPGQRILDIGCGFGGFARYAAERYGVAVVGITLSVEQAKVARERCAGFPVEIRIQDYRHVADGPYDNIVSIGMFEAVGSPNFAVFMDKVRSLLKENGLALLHTIGTACPYPTVDAWFHRRIFPNGELPSRASIEDACKKNLCILDFHEFPADFYPRTLQAWKDSFVAAWQEIERIGPQFDERFFRMWVYYLLSMVAAFSERRNVLWQLVLARDEDAGSRRGYVPIR